MIVGHGPLREVIECLLLALHTGNEALARSVLEGRFRSGRPDDPFFAPTRKWLEQLDAQGGLESWMRDAGRAGIEDRVVLTGYLDHRRLRHLFGCCDVAVFPSLVPEAGPLVFLEALASGVFPIGVYTAGIAAHIDALQGVVPPPVTELMKLRNDPAHLVADIISNVVAALRTGPGHATEMRRATIARHDWSIVARTLAARLEREATAG